MQCRKMEHEWRVAEAGIGERKGKRVGWVEGVEVELYVVGFSLGR